MTLVTWTIYDHPRDQPDLYVARKFIGEQPTDEVYGDKEDLDKLREMLSNAGFVCLSRSADDDPVIVETWL